MYLMRPQARKTRPPWRTSTLQALAFADTTFQQAPPRGRSPKADIAALVVRMAKENPSRVNRCGDAVPEHRWMEAECQCNDVQSSLP